MAIKRTSNLKFNISSILQRIKQNSKVEGVSINLPFLSINLTVYDDEEKIAREVLIRLRDKRVLVAWECCDDCIKNALASMQDIRTLLVNKQVELPDENSALFVLFDLMLAGIRQFLTFTERYYFHIYREEYFGALEVLRGHLLRCIEEISKVGNTTPQLSNRLNFNPIWEKEHYIVESSPSDSTA
ncbi:MAG TPA: hypothetical protein ACFYEM_09090 [Candidatus Hypogeohydataceae bacterium YC40]